jgi:hypothetical protein
MSGADVEQSSPVVLPRAYQIKAKQKRQTMIFLALILAVLLIGVAALGNWLQWWTFGTRQIALPCPVQSVTEPTMTLVNVINGTQRRGLAGAVAMELQRRHFPVAAVATEVRSKPINAVAYVRYGAGNAADARTVALQFPGKIKLLKDGRTSGTVDVVLGQNYKAMKVRSKAAAAIAPKPDPAGCTIVPTHSPGAA